MKRTLMTWHEALAHAQRLYSKWVSGDGKIDLDRIHASMLQESRWHRSGKSGATVGLIAEVKGELILLGKVRKACKAHNLFQTKA